METIEIRGLNVDTLIGVYEWERKRTTRLKLDIVLEADLSQAMQSDKVSDTIDYAAVAEHIQRLGQQCDFELLEAFGAHVMQSLLAGFSVTSVQLTLCKPGILPDAETVAVTMKQVRA